MADSLKSLLMDQLTDLHDSIVVYLDDHSARDVLGEDLDQLRSSGTGKSLVMLALLDDLLRITEIVLARQWHPLEPKFAEFAAPFFQSAAKTFSRKGLKHYDPFIQLNADNAGRFLDYHSGSNRPFGGHHVPTQWSGLRICTNVAGRYANPAIIIGYERLTKILLTALTERVPRINRDEITQLVDFLNDRCSDVRDQLEARNSDRQAISKARAKLNDLREELESRQSQLAEREHLIAQEWKRFQQERAEFEQLRQQWEERLAEETDLSAEEERLANERETLAIEKAALNHQRQELETLRAEWDDFRENSSVSASPVPTRQSEEARLAEERRQLQAERAVLEKERRELAALREKLLAGDIPPEEDHILFEPESPERDAKNAAVMTADDANQVLDSAVQSGDPEQVQAAIGWGADVNRAVAENGFQTPLHRAARQGHEEIAEILLEAGADAGQTDAESFNPLETAIINEQAQTARLLSNRVPETVAQAYPLLLRIMRDPKSPPLSRQLSVEAVATRRDEAAEAIPTLLNLLESENRKLGQTAAEALANIDPAAVTEQAIPYVSEILAGPLVRQETTDRNWVANLYAVRGDLCRLAGRFSQARRNYEAAVSLASPDQKPALDDLLSQLEPEASNTHSS